MIKGISGDFAILKAMWTGFVKSRNNVRGKLGQLKLKPLKVGQGNYQKINICANYAHPLIFQWESNGHFAYVDLKQSCIRLAKKIKEVTENVCIGAAIPMAVVLCQSRPPRPKDSNNVIAAYPTPPLTTPGVLNLDAMPFLVGSGLYASNLPRWYHTTCYQGYFCQIHPLFYQRRRNQDYRFDYDSHHHDVGIFNYSGFDIIFSYNEDKWNGLGCGSGWNGGCGGCDDSGSECGGDGGRGGSCGGSGNSGGGGCSRGDGCSGGGGCSGGSVWQLTGRLFKSYCLK